MFKAGRWLFRALANILGFSPPKRVVLDTNVLIAAAWNEVYGAEWNNEETNPHKPVRTNYLVWSLPGGRHVEVEAIVVLPQKTF